MGTEPPEAPVPVGRQNEASPWPTNQLNVLVLLEVDAVVPVAEYLLGGDVDRQHRRLLSAGVIPGPLQKKTTLHYRFLQAEDRGQWSVAGSLEAGPGADW